MLLSPTYNGIVVHSVQAYDPDIDSNLQYSIENGNQMGHFGINADSGDVMVANSHLLDRNYNLTVKVCVILILTILPTLIMVQFYRSGPLSIWLLAVTQFFCIWQVTDGIHESRYRLIVNVQRAVDSGLQFSEVQYEGEAVENTTDTQTILIIQLLNLGQSAHICIRTIFWQIVTLTLIFCDCDINRVFVVLELGQPVSFQLMNYRDKFDVGSTSGVLTTQPGSVLDREDKSRLVVYFNL